MASQTTNSTSGITCDKCSQENIGSSNMSTGKEAVASLRRGMKYATDAVRLSYGPKGKKALIQHVLPPYHFLAKDCDSIVQAIECTDPIEKMGLDLAKELSTKASKDSADGRKTTLLIADSILEEVLKLDKIDINLKSELDALIPVIENEVNKQKKEIGIDGVEAVATIAGESGKIGKLLQEIYSRIGKNGLIVPEGSNTIETSTHFVDGVRFIDTTFLSQFMCNDERRTKATYENPFILITKTKIEKDSEIEGLVQHSIDKSRALIIVCDDMDTGVAQRLIATHRAKVAKILIIKAPTLWKNYVYEDFAKVTGATIIEPASGINFKNLKLEHLGTCVKIEVDKEETVIMPNVDYSEHVDNLKQIGDNDSKLRLSWLQTKTCILKLGSNNETELSDLRLAVADAINSSRLALKDGIVDGGGVCLQEVSYTMPNTVAGSILEKALVAPYLQLHENSGEDYGEVSSDVVDAALVVKNAARNGIALASTILNIGMTVTLPPKPIETLKDKQMTW